MNKDRHIQIIEQVYNALSEKITQDEIPISLRHLPWSAQSKTTHSLLGCGYDQERTPKRRGIPSGKIDYPNLVLRHKAE